MLVSIIIFLIVLSVLVLVHELGHFIMARRSGVLVEEFGFGLPPKLAGIQIGETTYSINLFPFGGFVKLHGEMDEQSVVFPHRAFINKSKKTRVKILLAGVVMNFILAVVSFAIVYSFMGIPKETEDVKIVDITIGSPAQIAGWVTGDIVRTVDKQKITTISQFVDLVEKEKGKKVEIEIQRDGEIKKFTVTPRENPPENEGPLGVVITTTEVYYPPTLTRPFVGIFYGFKEALFWGKTVILGFVKIFTDLFGGRVPSDLAGPVGIFAITSEAAKMGILALINFVGILSVNLAILNVLPFPALDGGRLLFVFIEKAIGRKVLPQVESTIHTIGMIILLAALLAITAHDIQRVIAAGGISGFINSVLK
jgi:regulator of sigma E protease